MQVLLMTVPVLLPLAGGFFMLVMGTGREGAGKKQERNRLLFMEAVVLAASFSWWAVFPCWCFRQEKRPWPEKNRREVVCCLRRPWLC